MSVQLNDSIILPDSPNVPALLFRHFRDQSDYPGITVAGNASREADGAERIQTVDDVVREYGHLVHSDPAQDMIIAEIDGEIVGYTRGEWFQQNNGLYRYWFSLNLVPGWRGKRIRRTMLHWIEARMREIAANHPAESAKTFATFATDKAESLIKLLENDGYRPARDFNRMVRSLDDPLPAFAMPNGLEMRPALPEHYRLIWEADNEAFRDHWGQTPPYDEYYQEWVEDPVIFTPELWQIAWDVENNEIAGQVRTFIDKLENEKYNRRRGYTEYISVRQPYRRQGLARALIAESLRVLKSRGMTESALFVDSENITGATRLYDECGFKTVNRTTSYHKPLGSAA